MPHPPACGAPGNRIGRGVRGLDPGVEPSLPEHHAQRGAWRGLGAAPQEPPVGQGQREASGEDLRDVGRLEPRGQGGEARATPGGRWRRSRPAAAPARRPRLRRSSRSSARGSSLRRASALPATLARSLRSRTVNVPSPRWTRSSSRRRWSERIRRGSVSSARRARSTRRLCPTAFPSARTSRPRRAASEAARSSRTGTTTSAAWVGVAARTSATRSATVTSTSCPTALTTGTGQAAMNRASRSSLNSQRSSADPPPLVTTATSTPKSHEEAQRRDHRGGRTLPLHAAAGHEDLRAREAAVQHPQEVLQRSPGRTGRDADAGGQERKGSLARRVEETLGGEPVLELLECQRPGARAARLDLLDDQLVTASGRVESRSGRAPPPRCRPGGRMAPCAPWRPTAPRPRRQPRPSA